MSLLDAEDQSANIDPDKNYLEELVGEGKKFQSAAELARGKAESDAYIKVMEVRQDELRADYLRLRDEQTAGAKLQDLIDQMQGAQQNNTTRTKQVEDERTPEFDEAKLDTLLETKFQQRETKRRQEENYSLVKSKLKERYGANYGSVLKDQIDSLGLTSDTLEALAKNNPLVLIRTLGLDTEPQRDNFQSPPRSAQRNDSFAPKTQKRTWSYYQNLKKSDPVAYRDPKTTVQMHRDAQELGDAFKDGDYSKYGD